MLLRGLGPVHAWPSIGERFWRRGRLWAAAALGAASLALLLPGAAAVINSRPASVNPFVTSAGGRLMLEGRPWQFTGYDAYQLPSLAGGYNCGGGYSISWLNQMLDEMKAKSHTTVVRTWFFQSYSGDNFRELDTVLAAAAQRNIKIIPVLVNQWGDCEPGWGPQGQRPYRTRAWYQSGYKQTNDGYPVSFRDYAIKLATRYANNPTIAFWQLVNEAEDADNPQTGPWDPATQTMAAGALRGFADDMVGAIKHVDPNHLVSLGTLGAGQWGTQGHFYKDVNAGAVDICEYHDYGAPGTAVPGDQWNGVSADIQQCAALGKPIFAGEVGIDASVQPDGSASGPVTAASLQQRATFFQQKLQAQFTRGIAGFLIWNKSLGASGSYDVGPGDPTEAVLATFATQLDSGTGPGPLAAAVNASRGQRPAAPRQQGSGNPGTGTTSAAAAPEPLAAGRHEQVPLDGSAAEASDSWSRQPAPAATLGAGALSAVDRTSNKGVPASIVAITTLVALNLILWGRTMLEFPRRRRRERQAILGPYPARR